MIKAICFDLDGVYFESSGFEDFKNSLIELGASTKNVNHYLHGKPMNDFKMGITAENEYWESVVSNLKISTSIGEIKKLLVKNYSVNQDIHAAVIKARDLGYKTCICSNNFPTRIAMLEDKFNFLKFFDATVFSYEIGVLKPSRLIFQELLTRAKIEPEELVYSDDNAEKLSGADALGIKTFVFKDINQFTRELAKFGMKL